MNILGHTFPVDIYYTQEPVKNYLEFAIHTVIQIHTNEKITGDILLFLTRLEVIDYSTRYYIHLNITQYIVLGN